MFGPRVGTLVGDAVGSTVATGVAVGVSAGTSVGTPVAGLCVFITGAGDIVGVAATGLSVSGSPMGAVDSIMVGTKVVATGGVG